jgi:hypothetical protein
MHSFACTQTTSRLCMACGTPVCACEGLARGQCPVCYRGLLAGYSGAGDRKCGYAGCNNLAVASSPRVKYACYHHAVTRGGYKEPTAERVRAYEQRGKQPVYGVVATLRRYLDPQLPEGKKAELANTLARELCA